jgi:hypothetical protein
MNYPAKISALITIALLFSVSISFAQVSSVIGTLDLGNPAWSTYDLSNTSMIITADDYSKIYSYVVSGYNDGSWDGLGIVSSYAPYDPPHTLGILSGTDYLMNNGGDFFGYAVEDPWILIRYTLFGDSNLDGVVDDWDHYLVTDAYTLLNDSNPFNDPEINWLNGDYNYDGYINQLDYPDLVPEPSSLILLCMGGMTLFGLGLKKYYRAS